MSHQSSAAEPLTMQGLIAQQRVNDALDFARDASAHATSLRFALRDVRAEIVGKMDRAIRRGAPFQDWRDVLDHLDSLCAKVDQMHPREPEPMSAGAVSPRVARLLLG